MKYVLLTSLAICLFLFVTCSKNVVGNNTKTETRTIPAMLYNPGGSPAVHAKVWFYPINYNPHASGVAKKMAIADSATTDSTGNYSVKLDTGTYNVLASGDSGVVFQDSITVTKDSAVHPPADTLKAPGGLRGRVRLQPGDDPRTVFILFLGTNIWSTPDDSTGKFEATNMAQGTYRVRFLTTLNAYVPKDTTLSVTAGVVDSLPHDIVLQYTGVPGPTGLTVSYDTLRQTVILAWTGADTSMINGYNVYRAIKGQNFSLITQTPLSDIVTTYRDSTVTVGTTYQYEVVSRNAAGVQSTAVFTPGDTMKAVSSSLVTTTFTSNLVNAISDTASINDTIKVCLTYSNPTRKIVKVVWYADSLNSPVVRQKTDSSLTGKDTLTYSWSQTGNKKIFVKATDGAGSVWTDSVGVIINSSPSTPVITYPVNNGDTIWPVDRLRWHPSIDPNGNGVRYKVLVNYNNTGYSQLVTALTDTFIQLTGCCDSLPLKFKVMAYDTLGDSSAWSVERTAFISNRLVTDIDGNVYQTVTIGTQVWMVENLKTTRYIDGTAIPLDTNSSTWGGLTTPGYCWYNDSAIYGNTYGALYNWYAVNTGKLAPAGWHVPTDSEWTVLTTYLGGETVAGGKLKDTGTTYWQSPNTGATNASGFLALPGGFRSNFGPFSNIGYLGYWWSSTAYDATTRSWSRFMYFTSAVVVPDNTSINTYGYSVRCLKNP